MGDHQITCVTKPDRFSTREHITHIGNTAGHWKITRESAIQRIESKSDSFFTIDASTGKRAEIGVVREPGKAPYLRTYADGTWNDNLLAQAECDGSCRIV